MVTINKPLPSNVDNEQSTIGAVMIDPTCISQVDFLKPEHFYAPDHQWIWQACLDAELADPQVVAGLLRARGHLDKIGDQQYKGTAYLTILETTVISSLRIKTHALEVYKAAILRKGIENAVKIIEMAMTPKAPEIDEFCDQMEEMAGAVAEMNIQRKGPEEIAPVRERVMETVKNRYEGKTQTLSTGLQRLDYQIGGLEPGLDVLVAARTSIGKTELALSIAHNLVHAGKRVLIFSPELPADYLFQRLVQMEQEITLDVFKRPAQVLTSTAQLDQFLDSLRAFDYPLIFDDTPGITPIYIRNTIRRVQQQQQLDLVILDRGNLMEWPLYAKGGKTAEVQAIGNANKATARMLNIPLIETVQVNRDVESRKDKRPKLSDIMYGGEQAPDIVLLMYREDYYDPKSGKPNVVEINTAKNRHGGYLGMREYRRRPASGKVIDL
jgi:replicative DNA helicase